MSCACYGCPMKCRNMSIHRAIYWKIDKYYLEREKENYIPRKVKRIMTEEDDLEETKILKKPSSKINYEKLKEYQNSI